LSVDQPVAVDAVVGEVMVLAGIWMIRAAGKRVPAPADVQRSG
jgi:hypothetical protein